MLKSISSLRKISVTILGALVFAASASGVSVAGAQEPEKPKKTKPGAITISDDDGSTATLRGPRGQSMTLNGVDGIAGDDQKSGKKSENKPESIFDEGVENLKSAEIPTAPVPEPKELDGTQGIHTQLPVPKKQKEPRPVKTAAAGSGSDSSAAGAEDTQPKKKEKVPIPKVNTISYGDAIWAIKPGRKIAQGAVVPQAVQANPVSGQTGTINAAPQGDGQAVVNVRIDVPQRDKAVDTLMIYPWPVKPPKITNAIMALPDLPDTNLKNMILQSGYSNRIDVTRPYPLYGWRWVHCFMNAMRRSGEGYPHTMITMYPWVKRVMPYVVQELKVSNAQEEDRVERYHRAMEEYESTHIEIETLAQTQGLSPIPIKLNGKGIGQVKLPPGNWWLSGARVVPGLRFYWQVPFTVTENQTVNVQLLEANALVIQGGW